MCPCPSSGGEHVSAYKGNIYGEGWSHSIVGCLINSTCSSLRALRRGRRSLRADSLRNDGDRCWRESEYSKNKIYSGQGRWVCDSDGDRCRFEYAERKGNHHREHPDEDDRDR